MKRHLKRLIGFLTSVFFLFLPVVLWAAEPEHGGNGSGHEGGSVGVWGLLFPTINFLLFAFILRTYALPAVRDSLHQRRAKIVQALNEAKQAKEEAETLRREYEQKLAGLAAEQERLQTQALEAAEREKKLILSEARQMAERVQNEARQIAQREVEEARRLLRQEVAEQAVRLATEMLETRLTPGDRSHFVQSLVVEVNNVANASR